MFPQDCMIVLSAPGLKITETKREELLSKHVIKASQEHFGECTIIVRDQGTEVHFAIPKFGSS